MPFPDEVVFARVRVGPYRPEWAQEAASLAEHLTVLVSDAVAVEHIGSTSIPGMVAKDCLDMMVVVTDLAASCAQAMLTREGYRQRPEQWNLQEPANGRMWPKLVFAPPVGARSVNIHIRLAHAPSARRALLFRDYLRANPATADTWVVFKQAAADAADDLFQYGSLKDPAWLLLMELAEAWADGTNWAPPWPIAAATT